MTEGMVEREIKDLLCDGKITPAQVGTARMLLSCSGSRVSGFGLKAVEPETRNAKLETSVVFREFLAAMPRGAAVDFTERTRGLRGLRRGGGAGAGTAEGGCVTRGAAGAGHEELARENLEIAGLTHRGDAEDGENG